MSVRPSISVCLSVYPYARPSVRAAPTGRVFWNLTFGPSQKSIQKHRIWL